MEAAAGAWYPKGCCHPPAAPSPTAEGTQWPWGPPPGSSPGTFGLWLRPPERGDGGFDSLCEGGRERKSDRLARRRSQRGCLVLTGFYSLFNYNFVKLEKKKRGKKDPSRLFVPVPGSQLIKERLVKPLIPGGGPRGPQPRGLAVTPLFQFLPVWPTGGKAGCGRGCGGGVPMRRG